MRKSTALGIFCAMLLAAPVFGHAKLLRALPAAESRLASPPAALTLTFNENVRLGRLKLSTAGRSIPVTLDRAAAASSSVTVALPSLAAGRYDVEWSALTLDDGHVVKGAYSFVVL